MMTLLNNQNHKEWSLKKLKLIILKKKKDKKAILK